MAKKALVSTKMSLAIENLVDLPIGQRAAGFGQFALGVEWIVRVNDFVADRFQASDGLATAGQNQSFALLNLGDDSFRIAPKVQHRNLLHVSTKFKMKFNLMLAGDVRMSTRFPDLMACANLSDPRIRSVTSMRASA